MALFAALLMPSLGLGQTLLQTFFVPVPETQVRTWADAIQDLAENETIHSVISITLTTDGTVIHYDQWENGFEPNLANPLDVFTPPGLNDPSTQVWGDGDSTNGAPPGFPTDLLNAGDVIILQGDVPLGATNTRDPAQVFFDGGDKFASTQLLAVTRAAWPSTGVQAQLGGAVEVFDTSEWGVNYDSPVGEDIAQAAFEFVAYSIQAREDLTLVSVDANADGDFLDPGDLQNVLLSEGESILVPDVLVGGEIVSDGLVQVDILTANEGTTYEGRWFSTIPNINWSDSYYSPVGTTVAGDDTHVYVYNPDPTATITVTEETLVGTQTINVGPGGVVERALPLNTPTSAAHYFTASGDPFFAVATTDRNETIHDWGYTLIPEPRLTIRAAVGWAPGSTNLTENASPIWVTPVADTTFEFDCDGDGTPEFTQFVQALESFRLFIGATPPAGCSAFDATGLQIEATSGGTPVRFAAAWGQDPANSSSGQPQQLDMGTSVVPLATPFLLKEAELVADVNGNGVLEPGDTLRFTITVLASGTADIDNVVLTDTPDSNVVYVVDSTVRDGTTPISDQGTTPFPLDEGGVNLGTLSPGQLVTVSYDATVVDPLPAGVTGILNTAEITVDGTPTSTSTSSNPVQDPLLLITKVSNAVGDVVPGQELEYTITVTNNSPTTQTSIEVSDLLPVGTSYVDESTEASGPARLSREDLGPVTIDGTTTCGGGDIIRTFNIIESFVLGDVNLGFVADHTWRGDIQVTLQSPTLTRRVVIVDPADADADNNYDLLLDDASAAPLDDGDIDDTTAPFYERTVAPSIALSAFNGENSAGTWTLEICDVFPGLDDGTYLRARLDLFGTAGSTITKTNQLAAPLPLLDGIPPDLVEAGDGFGLLPNESLTVTYRVTAGSDPNITRIVNTAMATSFELPFFVGATVIDPVSPGGLIGDLVWLDVDGDGLADVGEPGLANVTVDLIEAGPDGTLGTLDDVTAATTITDANGNYVFQHLPPGTYRVDVDETTLPGGLTTTAGTTDPSSAVVITGEERFFDVDFGFTVSAPGTAIIGDRVWADVDGDGVQDAGELGVSSVVVNLLNLDGTPAVDSGGTPITAVTGPDGSYLLTGIPAGEYRVEIDPSNFLAGGPLDTADGWAVTIGPQSEGSTLSNPVLVTPGDIVTDIDFGFDQPNLFAVSDAVWLDSNADGLRDAGEPAIAGVTVDLVGPGPDGVFDTADDEVLGTTASDGNGDFSFPGVPDGVYQIQISDTAGELTDFGGTTAPAQAGELDVTVAGADVAAENFGYVGAGMIGDTVWSDADGDGVQDPGEPGLPGVVVNLRNAATGNLVATASTGADGSYLFEDLPPGSYVVEVDTSNFAVGGALEGAAQTGDPTFLNTPCTGTDCNDSGSSVLDFGTADESLDFGYQLTALANVSGTVWNDTDADGVNEGGPREPGIGGVTLDLVPVFSAIDGRIDVDGDGDVDAVDDGVVDGVPVIDGRLDLNGDGVINGADDGQFNGVAVIDGELDLDGDGVAGEVNGDDTGSVAGPAAATTTTVADGSYSFLDVPDGDYRVIVTDDAARLTGYRLTSGLDEFPVTVAGVDVTDVDFGYVRDVGTGSIGDTVWLDTNADGVPGASEPGLSGVSLDLIDVGPDGVPGTADDVGVVATTTTDASGGYVFGGLLPGNYVVDVTDLGPDGLPATGDEILTGLAETVGTSDPSAAVPLSEGEIVTDIDFGYVPGAATATIGDRVWYDADGDGVQDLGEVGIEGIDIQIFGPGCNPCVETTGPDGTWLATGLAGGDYSVTFVDADITALGYSATPTNNGGDDVYNVTLAVGDLFTNLDFGFNGGTTGTIGDLVYEDRNGNGTLDGTDTGIEGVTVDLINTDTGAIVATTTTASDGSYLFQGLPPGNYGVVVTDLTGALTDLNPTEIAASPIVITAAGETVLTADFGYAPAAGTNSIGNQVWRDKDGDGVFEPLGDDGTPGTGDDEPGIPGVTIDLWLDDGDGVFEPFSAMDNYLRTVVTDANGEYFMDALPDGTYWIDVTDTGPDGVSGSGDEVLTGLTQTFGTPNTDNNGQADPYQVVLSGVSDFTGDFGYNAAADLSISGTVFEDGNNNAVLDDPADPIVPGAVVSLYRIVNGVRVLYDTYVTGSDSPPQPFGFYEFVNLPPGNYEIEVDPTSTVVEGFMQTTQTGTGGIQLVTLVATDVTDQDFGFWNGGITTTPVTLAYFEAIGGGSVEFRWMTSTEVGNLGFNVYSLDGDSFEKLNEELIASHVVDSLEPQIYEFEAFAGSAETFLLEDVDIQGQSRYHGPFHLNESQGSKVTEAKEVAWGSIRAEKAKRKRATSRLGKRSVRAAEAGGATFAGAAVGLGTGGEGCLSCDQTKKFGYPALQLGVSESGIHRVTYEDLLAAGIDYAGAKSQWLSVTRGEEVVPVTVVSSGVFGPGAYVEFVGEALETLYTKTNVYRLSVDRNRVARAPEVSYGAGVAASFYVEEAKVETQRKYHFASPIGDPWYDARVLAISGPVEHSVTFDLEGWYAGAAPVEMDIKAWGVTDFPTAPDHHLVLEVNGLQVGEEWFDGLFEPELRFAIGDGSLTELANTLTLKLPHDTGAQYDLVNYDHLVVRYPRAFLAQGDRLSFRSAESSFTVSGFVSDDLVAYRVLDGTVERLEVSVSGAPGGFAGSVSGAGGSGAGADYYVTSVEAIRKPVLSLAPETNDLLSEPAQVLVVSHPDFLGGLADWANVRRSEGLSVKLADVRAVYARYSGGVVDPEAIRDYVRAAHTDLGTEYLLLVGGDSYDYFDYLGLGSMSFVPSLYAQTDSIVRYAPVDPLFGDVDDDLVPDVAVGRWPVRTLSELESVVEKTLSYTNVGESLTAVMAADGLDIGSGYSFSGASDAMASLLGPDWDVNRVYLDEQGLAEARTDLIDGVSAGPALTSYFGHSGLTVWSFQGLFKSEDVELLENANAPTIVTQWGCWNTYHVLPSFETLGNRLLLEQGTGAAAVLGAATLTEAASEQRLGERMFARIGQPGTRLGTALLEAKQDLASTEPGRLDVILGWTLLGDPTLAVRPQ